MLRFLGSTAILAVVAAIAFGAPVPDGTWPISQGHVTFPEVYVVKSGEVFDGGMKTYDRSDITCLGHTESNVSTAVFEVEPGATLKYLPTNFSNANTSLAQPFKLTPLSLCERWSSPHRIQNDSEPANCFYSHLSE
ncbi:hypothetical protein PPTG_19417 [Phytophthora nicotianae INRA-310]|uniref:Probable pectate lyase F n=1 Tax=Phytophthora nicotianae (strain INRA-310) TaxID=761204 RepID=W2PEZ1_PHYN3|nr:hypothetical protein PPTG_19417 [Phytophthora nicotianae INRA-310]ETM98569.1 hypothetical protein PPTG_19417 [Phytophthora nicotianae INRA-310]